jgi:hypothetical protein
MANCATYASVAKQAGLAFSWGVELQTSEEIHLLVYFDDPEAAQAFDAELYASLLPLDNDPDFFGDQVVIDENEQILRMENRALINSTLWDLTDACETARSYGGFVVPAHVDAGTNSILSQLGMMPEEPVFDAFGITAGLDTAKFVSRNPWFQGKSLFRSSDAHYLADLGTGIARVYCQEPTVKELQLACKSLDNRRIE